MGISQAKARPHSFRRRRVAHLTMLCICVRLAFQSGAFVPEPYGHSAVPRHSERPKHTLLQRQPHGCLKRAAAGWDEKPANRNHDHGFFALPRDVISLAYLSFGATFTMVNILGVYHEYDKVVL